MNLFLHRPDIEKMYYFKKMNIREIAEVYKVSQKKLWYFMVKHNISRRNKKEISISDLTGKEFGNLLVIRRAMEYEKNKGALWMCQCKCGGEKIVRGTSLSSGNTKSCGCKWKRASFKKISGSYWWGIQNNAKKRNLDFSITKEKMWELFLEQNEKCALSHVDINFGNGLTRKLQTASLDRIDSSKGYIDGNVRWVHKDVNKMKWNMTDEIFMEWIKKIFISQKLKS